METGFQFRQSGLRVPTHNHYTILLLMKTTPNTKHISTAPEISHLPPKMWVDGTGFSAKAEKWSGAALSQLEIVLSGLFSNPFSTRTSQGPSWNESAIHPSSTTETQAFVIALVTYSLSYTVVHAGHGVRLCLLIASSTVPGPQKVLNKWRQRQLI